MTGPSTQAKELIILTEHFWPSTGATAQLVSDLVDDLHAQGCCLRVLTSTPGSSRSSYPIHRFSSSSKVSVGILGKLIDGLHFFLGSTYWLLRYARTDQGLLIVSNPPFIGLVGPLMSLLRQLPYVFLLQDIFPRSAVLTGVLPAKGPLSWIWRQLLALVLSGSQATVVLSSSMISRCRKEFGDHFRLVSIPNWAVVPVSSSQKSLNSLAQEWGIDSVFTVQYSGNFGRLHDILTILEAARLLADRPLKFVFVGGGAKRSQIQAYCQAYGLSNVILQPYQPREQLSTSLSACDVALVSHISGSEDTVAPSKLYGILACSRPVLLIASEECELARIIDQAACGVVIQQGDVQGLVGALLMLQADPQRVATMSEQAGALYQSQFGRDRSTAAYLNLFRQCQMI
ncbi:glycosyltransferase family 4 protein [Synechococcus sp. A10-1-5-1]|uniref:glycosyltransferase family 4 protein n=1 Tax=Synechococcus sp. A10-1-5-1 TaxID=2936507 RepID=UPI002001AE1E|nr:glycosyltransferase family 4 protein [Synechococcus sp. A10-1-5-1]UPM49210.1 glycosyltransferase family 4 protein [Synechococcus sp. A10-1-5-1]